MIWPGTATEHEPGIYPDMPETIYRSDSALSQSTLRRGRISMAHVRHTINSGTKGTDSMKLGSAAHAAVLEPDRFEELYAEGPEGVRKGTKAWSAAVESAEGRELLKPDAYAAALAIRDGILADPNASKLIRARGASETAFFWKSEDLHWKGKADRLLAVKGGRHWIADVKTTSDISQRGIEKATEANAIQAAMYVDGIQSITGESPVPFVFIFVESAAPHAVRVRQVGTETLAAGRSEYLSLAARYRQAIERNDWNQDDRFALEQRVPVIEAPSYYRRQNLGGLETI